jgi:hypothetical protein
MLSEDYPALAQRFQYGLQAHRRTTHRFIPRRLHSDNGGRIDIGSFGETLLIPTDEGPGRA